MIRRKGQNGSERWDIIEDGVVIGHAQAVHKTRTQRTWDASVTVNGNTYSVTGEQSVRTAMDALQKKIDANDFDQPQVATAEVAEEVTA